MHHKLLTVFSSPERTGGSKRTAVLGTGQGLRDTSSWRAGWSGWCRAISARKGSSRSPCVHGDTGALGKVRAVQGQEEPGLASLIPLPAEQLSPGLAWAATLHIALKPSCLKTWVPLHV